MNPASSIFSTSFLLPPKLQPSFAALAAEMAEIPS
jgi:hypothetical protein